jgi:hypothetical protein
MVAAKEDRGAAAAVDLAAASSEPAPAPMADTATVVCAREHGQRDRGSGGEMERSSASALEEAGARGGKVGAPPAHGLHVLATRRSLEPDVEHVVCVKPSDLEAMVGLAMGQTGLWTNCQSCSPQYTLQFLFKHQSHKTYRLGDNQSPNHQRQHVKLGLGFGILQCQTWSN